MMRSIWLLLLVAGLDIAAEQLPVETRHIDRKLAGCGDEKDGCAHADFTYIEVIGGPSMSRQRINAAIGACLRIIHDATPAASAQSFIHDYQRAQSDLLPFERHWFLTRTVKVLSNTAYIFSLERTVGPRLATSTSTQRPANRSSSSLF
jgi:hypothetical protein